MPCTAPPAPRRLTGPCLRSVGNEKWVWTFDQFVDLPYVWVTSSDTIPTGPSGGLLQVNMTRVIQDNSTVAGQTERVNSLGYYCETLLNILRVRPWAALALGVFRGCARVRPVPAAPPFGRLPPWTPVAWLASGDSSCWVHGRTAAHARWLLRGKSPSELLRVFSVVSLPVY